VINQAERYVIIYGGTNADLAFVESRLRTVETGTRRWLAVVLAPPVTDISGSGSRLAIIHEAEALP
jgi:hypothetical protein